MRDILIVLIMLLIVITGGCKKKEPANPDAGQVKDQESAQTQVVDFKSENRQAAVSNDDIPRFAANSPFSEDFDEPAAKMEKRLWAKSILWQEAPEFKVEKWLGPEPDMEGKYLLIEFWATWCPHCVRAIPKLNSFHEKYKDNLVVIGITDEPEEDLKKFDTHPIKFYNAIDTKARMKSAIEVEGIPHAIIVEPEDGFVIWEGFPLLPGHELTEDIIERIINVGKGRGAIKGDK